MALPYFPENVADPHFLNFGSAYGPSPSPVIPVAGICDWFTAHPSPSTASNAGNSVTRVDSITGVLHKIIPCTGATTLRVRAKYDPSSAKTTTGPPTIQIIGIDSNGIPELLSDADNAVEWSLAVAAGDVASAADAFFTTPIEVDLRNNCYAIVYVKTAATGTAWTDADAAILAKLL